MEAMELKGSNGSNRRIGDRRRAKEEGHRPGLQAIGQDERHHQCRRKEKAGRQAIGQDENKGKKEE